MHLIISSYFCRAEFLGLMKSFNPGESEGKLKCLLFFEKAYRLMRRTWFIDFECLEHVCRYINWSATQTDGQYCYLSIGMLKDKAVRWLQHLKEVIRNCLEWLKELRPVLVIDVNRMALVLTTVVFLTSIEKWPILNEDKYKMLKVPMRRFTQAQLVCLKTGGYLTTVNDLLEQAFARPGQVLILNNALLGFYQKTMLNVVFLCLSCR